MSLHDEVTAAAHEFYKALNEFLAGNTSRMSDVWLDDEAISTAHPRRTVENMSSKRGT